MLENVVMSKLNSHQGRGAYPPVAVVQTDDELLKYPARLLLLRSHRVVLQGVAQQVATPGYLHDNADEIWGCEHLSH
jgi:hypothetical protein